MPRPPGKAGTRHNTVCTKLTDTEAQALDRLKGHMDRSTYLRWLLREQLTRTEQHPEPT